MSEAVHDRIVVDADQDTVMDVIADFEAYPQWQDEITKVEVLETDEHGWGTRVRYVVDAKIMQAQYVLAYSYSDTAMRWELVESEQLTELTGSYELADRGDGSTEVVYTLALVPKMPVPGMLRRQAARRIVDGALKSMKRRVEERA